MSSSRYRHNNVEYMSYMSVRRAVDWGPDSGLAPKRQNEIYGPDVPRLRYLPDILTTQVRVLDLKLILAGVPQPISTHDALGLDQPAGMLATTEGAKANDFVFPRTYSFPPFFTPQPNALTRQSQLRRWSSFVQSYCRHHRIYKVSVVEALETPLFHNVALKKRLSGKDARDVLDFMASKDGDERAEWLATDKSTCWVWWRKPEEWANLIAHWVDETGQKGVVFTLYELVQGDATEHQDFYGLDLELLRKSLNTLVKKGKAQIFGIDDQQGVKFF